MTDSQTLALAREQALAIHLAIAKMERSDDTWKRVDDLLETLTTLSKLFQEPPPLPPPPTEQVLRIMESTLSQKGTPIGITIAKLSRLTELPQESVRAVIETLAQQGRACRFKQRGVHAYTLTRNRAA